MDDDHWKASQLPCAELPAALTLPASSLFVAGLKVAQRAAPACPSLSTHPPLLPQIQAPQPPASASHV